jgi:GTP-binding protein Era
MTPEQILTRTAVFALFGPPNAGKSTLMNAIIGEKIAPMHRRPQMTRKNLLGIFTEGETQLIFIDTPGFHESEAVINRELRQELIRAASDCDVLVVLLDAGAPLPPELIQAVRVAIAKKNHLFVLNKSDLPREKWRTTPQTLVDSFGATEVLCISAKTGAGKNEFLAKLKSLAMPGAFLYPEDEMTAATMREIAANCILEKLMEHLGQEIPYQMAVIIEDYKERPQQDEIRAILIVNRDSQKGMVIGKGGAMLKKIGMSAREDLVAFLGKKVRLDLFVKVDCDWVRDPRKIREYCGF